MWCMLRARNKRVAHLPTGGNTCAAIPLRHGECGTGRAMTLTLVLHLISSVTYSGWVVSCSYLLQFRFTVGEFVQDALEVVAGEFPLEWFGGLLVVQLEVQDALLESFEVVGFVGC